MEYEELKEEVCYRIENYLYDNDCYTEEAFNRDIDWIATDECIAIVSENDCSIPHLELKKDVLSVVTWKRYSELYNIEK
jgi:hypothetical protein